MTIKSDGTQGAASPAQPSGAASVLTAEEVKAIVAETLRATLPETLNPAITGHIKRLKNELDEKLSQLAPASSKPEEKGKIDDQVIALQKRLDASDAEARATAAKLAKVRRDADLKRVIADAGAFDVDVVFRQLTHEDQKSLDVDSNGNYYAVAPDGSFLTPQEFVRRYVEASPWTLKAAGKSGGGNVPGAPVQRSGARIANPTERLRQAYETGPKKTAG